MSNNEITAEESREKLFIDQLNEVSVLKFSKNALHSLSISDSGLSVRDLQQLQLGFEKAANKGSEVSLIIVNNIAYIVSIKNSTVITALSDYGTKKKVVNEIDSIVFM
ncbi:flagellar protein [Iocasia frigidifontis]|uniref:Flagellar protein n=1 Tax=Iocasia fonsfrigidae TaxID=2682810 RepID=A0A8A7KF96_9FIRM|nr:flagellar protein [Iocasia fonsfrigidae]QTL98755.1 flagellar protein [Iocasia fonsfrigidae]